MDAAEILMYNITVWSPIHDIIGTNEAYRKDALDYLRGKIDSPFPPPEFLVDVFRKITDSELEYLKTASNTTEAYQYIRWLREKQRSPSTAGPAPAMTSTPKQQRRKSRGGHRISIAEETERLRLAPTMTSHEFARHFGLKKPGSACKWCLEHGVRLKGMPR